MVTAAVVVSAVKTRRASAVGSVPVVVATSAPVPVAAPPVVVASPTPVAPVAPISPVAPVTPPPTVDPDADNTARAKVLFARIRGLAGCNKACVQVLRTLTLAQIRRDPKGAGDFVQDCKQQCSQ
jgi:hypothetical protein